MKSSSSRSKVEFCYGAEPDYDPGHPVVFVENVPNFKQLAWLYLFQEVTYRSFSSEGERLLVELKKVVEQVHLVASDYRDLRAKTTNNILELVCSQAKIVAGDQLQLSLPSAIVCGSGPSLQKNISNIQRAKGKIPIIASGSSLQILLHAGIIPDFAASLDPDPEIDSIIEEVEIPLLFQERLGARFFQKMRGPKIFMGSASAFPLDHYLLQAAGIAPFFLDAGWGAASFAVSCAKFFGASQIALFGVDGTEDLGKTQLDRTHSLSWIHDLGIEVTPVEKLHSKPLPEMVFRGQKIQNPREKIVELQNEIFRLESCQEEVRPIFEAELCGSILSELIFDPIWLVYKHIFAQEEGDLTTHKYFFYQRLLKTYKDVLC